MYSIIRSKFNGFTLIELSIVLVIIGLIIGGVLVGRDLINSAGIRKQIKQFDSYKLALNAFNLKYNCLPGDCKDATAYGLGSNGDGNGRLEFAASSLANCLHITDGNRTQPDCYWDGEFPLFFQHLSAAQMIDGNFDGTWELGKGYPKVVLNEAKGMMVAGGWGTSSIDTVPDYLSRDYGFPNADGYWLHAKICEPSETQPYDADECVSGIFTPAQAQQIDTKIDDGKPLSGIFWGYTSSNGWSGLPRLGLCLNGSNTAYNLTAANLTTCLTAYKLK